MIGLRPFCPPPSQPFPCTTAHPAKIAFSKPSHARSRALLLYSIHRFIISDTGTIGINLTKLPQARKCLISTVHPDSIAGRHGLEEGDEILAPRFTSGVEHSDVYNLFISASKHRPLLFEIKRPYKPPSNTRTLLPRHHSLHRFIITKPGRLGIFLEIDNSMVRLNSVTLNSLGDFYGLRKNDILCKPLTNGELYRDMTSFVEAVKSCERPFIIEVWRALPTSTRHLITSIRMPDSTSSKSENPFMFSFPPEEPTIDKVRAPADASEVTERQMEMLDTGEEGSTQATNELNVKKGDVGKEIISIDDDSIDDSCDGPWECDICKTEFDTFDKALECEIKCGMRNDSAEEEKKKDN
jgi:hypothetical protein